MSAPQDPDELRGELRAGWEQAAGGWGERAQALRDWGMPVSSWMIDRLALEPGQRVLELAAGAGDTGFLAAEIVAPGGGLVISSDGAEAMVEVARGRASELGIRNVEFRQLELEWIDLPTADVDAVLCRWGVMLIVDPAACLQECRRVLRPGGRIALAVWDVPEANPWMTVPRRALSEVAGAGAGSASASAADGPGPFALASPERLQALLEGAGFFEVVIEPVAVAQRVPSVEAFLEQTLALSTVFRHAWESLDSQGRERVADGVRKLTAEFAGPDGGLVIPGQTLAATAGA